MVEEVGAARDLAETAGIKVEIIPALAEAEALIRNHQRAAILVFGKGFSNEINRCSFMRDGINPFYRDGVYLEKVDAELLKDPTQGGAASIIEQVAQVTLLRVILPWMIGRAFERLSDPQFITILGDEVKLPSPMSKEQLRQFMTLYSDFERGQVSVLRLTQAFTSVPKKTNLACNAACGLSSWAVNRNHRISLGETLAIAAENSVKDERGVSTEMQTEEYRKKVGAGVQAALGKQFEKYNLRGKTWADLMKSQEPGREGANAFDYVNRDGEGFLKRGAVRYQVLVPSYTVMFAFFLALIVGWVFVAERSPGNAEALLRACLDDVVCTFCSAKCCRVTFSLWARDFSS